MKRTFAYGAATVQGKWPVQEDGFFVDPGAGIFAVADGFGGRGNGDIAAKMALQHCRVPVGNRQADQPSNVHSPAQRWQKNLFGEINKKVISWNERRPVSTRGGCSLVVASVEQEREIVITSCGACSAFLLRNGVWLPLLSSQSPPRASIDAALFPAQALGIGAELEPETRAFTWGPGDILFLFSSGLAWEREGFQAELGGQAALRVPGGDLAAMAALAAEGSLGDESLWNQTAIAVEALL